MDANYDDQHDQQQDQQHDQQIMDDIGQSYNPKSEFSKPAVVQRCLENCYNVRSKELKQGYFNTTIDKRNGSENKVWISDSRKVFISAVDGMKSILYPECLRDENMKTYLKTFEENKQKIFDRFCYEEQIAKLDNDGMLKLYSTGVKFIPETDRQILKLIKIAGVGIRTVFIKGFWNPRVELYWDTLIPLYDELFSQLNLLCDRNNYFVKQMRFG